jgi:hypothetical protein
MGVWQGVAMDPGPSCPTLLCPVGGPPLKWPYSHFRNGQSAGQAACSHLLPTWTPHAVPQYFERGIVLESLLAFGSALALRLKLVWGDEFDAVAVQVISTTRQTLNS